MVQKIDISNELKKIQDAVYGEEVRSSIHDGINKAADTTNLIIEEWSDVNDSMDSLKNDLEASENQRVSNEETRENQETLRQQNTSKAIQEINTVKNTVEQKLNDGEFTGASGVWLGDSVPSADYDVWVKPTDIEGISGLFIRNQELWYEITSIKGEKGSIPKHEVLEKKIRFENSDGSWGAWIDLSSITAKDILTNSGKTVQSELDNILSDTGWKNVNTSLRYRVVNNVVTIVGIGGQNAQVVGDGKYTSVGNLPLAARPTYAMPFALNWQGASQPASAGRVDPNGDVGIFLPTGITNSYWAFTVTYLI